jgi:hypothetical protein
MLGYSERAWRNFLNPSSNLNRFRLASYREVFDAHFQRVDVTVLKWLGHEFHAARARICLEFLCGDETIDSAALIQIWAKAPAHL